MLEKSAPFLVAGRSIKTSAVADRNISFPFLLTWTGKCRSLTPTLDRAIL
jgi:hypothetical protein